MAASNPHLILSPGTRVVTLTDVEVAGTGHVRGSVAVVAEAPADPTHAYRVRFADGAECSLHRHQVSVLSTYKADQVGAGGGGPLGEAWVLFSGSCPLGCAGSSSGLFGSGLVPVAVRAEALAVGFVVGSAFSYRDEVVGFGAGVGAGAVVVGASETATERVSLEDAAALCGGEGDPVAGPGRRSGHGRVRGPAQLTRIQRSNQDISALFHGSAVLAAGAVEAAEDPQ